MMPSFSEYLPLHLSRLYIFPLKVRFIFAGWRRADPSTPTCAVGNGNHHFLVVFEKKHGAQRFAETGSKTSQVKKLRLITFDVKCYCFCYGFQFSLNTWRKTAVLTLLTPLTVLDFLTIGKTYNNVSTHGFFRFYRLVVSVSNLLLMGVDWYFSVQVQPNRS